MKKFIAFILCMSTIFCLASVSAFAATNGSGEVQINSHIYSRYEIEIPATVDVMAGDETACQVTIKNAQIEDGYVVKVYATGLVDIDGGKGIQLTHANGTNKVGCNVYTSNHDIANDSTPLVSFDVDSISEGTATSSFYLNVDRYGKPGDYAGTLTYMFDCVPQQ